MWSEIPGARQMAEGVVPGRVGGVEADRGAEHPVLAHEPGLARTQEDAVGAEDRREALLGRVGGEVPDVAPQEGLATRQDEEDVRVDLRDLVHHPSAFGARELAARVGAREGRHVAVRALEVASLGEIPRHRVRGVTLPA